MCQCFLARKTPASMNLPDDELKAAEAEGVVIKTPTDGGPPMAENDLVVESLVLRQLSHPNILRLLGGGATATGARCETGGCGGGGGGLYSSFASLARQIVNHACEGRGRGGGGVYLVVFGVAEWLDVLPVGVCS